jgi:hypothetical protein
MGDIELKSPPFALLVYELDMAVKPPMTSKVTKKTYQTLPGRVRLDNDFLKFVCLANLQWVLIGFLCDQRW